jgi:hypothetical protein
MLVFVPRFLSIASGKTAFGVGFQFGRSPDIRRRINSTPAQDGFDARHRQCFLFTPASRSRLWLRRKFLGEENRRALAHSEIWT